jgi:hypothetical protein
MVNQFIKICQVYNMYLLLDLPNEILQLIFNSFRGIIPFLKVRGTCKLFNDFSPYANIGIKKFNDLLKYIIINGSDIDLIKLYNNNVYDKMIETAIEHNRLSFFQIITKNKKDPIVFNSKLMCVDHIVDILTTTDIPFTIVPSHIPIELYIELSKKIGRYMILFI